MSQPIIIIPARMGSTRLPGKPMIDIVGKPMIVHVFERAVASNIGPVVVATDSPEIVHSIKAHGGNAVLTDSALSSGTERIHQALEEIDPGKAHDIIINLQGDLPDIAPALLRRLFDAALHGAADIVTAICPISSDEDKTNPNVVKFIGALINGNMFRALYFTRATAPWGDGPIFEHVGLYVYTRKALDRFVALPPSELERRERLEQLRALEDGMSIHALQIDVAPVGVDSPEDLEKARFRLTLKGK